MIDYALLRNVDKILSSKKTRGEEISFSLWWWRITLDLSTKSRLFKFIQRSNTVLAHVRPHATKTWRVTVAVPSRARVARSSRKSEGTWGVEWEGDGAEETLRHGGRKRGGGRRKCRREAAAGCAVSCRQIYRVARADPEQCRFMPSSFLAAASPKAKIIVAFLSYAHETPLPSFSRKRSFFFRAGC